MRIWFLFLFFFLFFFLLQNIIPLYIHVLFMSDSQFLFCKYDFFKKFSLFYTITKFMYQKKLLYAILFLGFIEVK